MKAELKKTSATALIAAAKAKAADGKVKIPPALRTELTVLVKHNTTARQSERVCSAAMIALCETYGVKIGRDRLRNLVRQIESELSE